jgi:perosamine synthetase
MYKNIPLSAPLIEGNEWQYIKECLDTGWVSSAGKYVELFETRIAQYTGSKYAIACMNGTAALQVALRLAGVQVEDEVIVPTITFIASVNAIVYNGAIPLFMDADEFYNIDVKKTTEFIKEGTYFKGGYSYNKHSQRRVRGILPVHIFGNAVDLEVLFDLCETRNIVIVEDAAESLGTRYVKGRFKGRHTGTIGLLGCLSFNGNKIITTGGGGMVLTDDHILAEKARYLTTQAKNDPIRYIHDQIGYNFRMTNIQAALGVAQLEQLPGILMRKKEIFDEYQLKINSIKGVTLAKVPEIASNNHWLNILQVTTEKYEADYSNLMSRFKDVGIEARPLWYPNHLQKPYINNQFYKIEKAVRLWERSICLPSSTGLQPEELKKVISQIYG